MTQCVNHRTICAAMLLLAGLSVEARAGKLRVPKKYPTIQAAIQAADHGDRVVVAEGVYTGAGNVDIDLMGKSIRVECAGDAASCVIDCQATPQSPRRGFIIQRGETANCVIEGFTIRNGATPDGAIDDRFNGAGILVTQGSSPTIRNMVIENARAGCWGGAICCSHQSSPVIENCVMRNNYSGDDGGALFAWNGSRPTVINCLIVDNEAQVTGGGVTFFDLGSVIINSTIVGNTAPWGAGVLNSGGGSTIVNSIIRGNTGNQQIWGTADVTFSNVEGGFAGEGNLDADAMFLAGPSGDYYLSQKQAGQGDNSPCLDAGQGKARKLGLKRTTTRIDGKADRLAVDLGYHYPR